LSAYAQLLPRRLTPRLSSGAHALHMTVRSNCWLDGWCNALLVARKTITLVWSHRHSPLCSATGEHEQGKNNPTTCAIHTRRERLVGRHDSSIGTGPCTKKQPGHSFPADTRSRTPVPSCRTLYPGIWYGSVWQSSLPGDSPSHPV